MKHKTRFFDSPSYHIYTHSHSYVTTTRACVRHVNPERVCCEPAALPLEAKLSKPFDFFTIILRTFFLFSPFITKSRRFEDSKPPNNLVKN